MPGSQSPEVQAAVWNKISPREAETVWEKLLPTLTGDARAEALWHLKNCAEKKL